MSGKNRAFAFAVATAALVGLSAPVASAATFSGPSGFNNDSILNVSGNQLPVQACNLVPIAATALGLLSTGNQASATNPSCTQNPAATNTTATTAGPAATTANSTPSGPSGDTTSGFNNSSVVNASGNQLPVQACNLVPIAAALGILSPGAISAAQASCCAQNPSATNSSSVTSSN